MECFRISVSNSFKTWFEALMDEALRFECLRDEALRFEALSDEALRFEALSDEALRFEALGFALKTGVDKKKPLVKKELNFLALFI